ncbi:MAG: class I SAM-dependent methyltransferase [Candidatus Micrarchaeota archaeon]
METGGGEIFSSLAPFPKHAVAYEGYEPNIPIARRRLTPLGVGVVRADSFPLPFKDAEFDLVLNRHGAIDAAEIHRILENGGLFLTQQVTGSDGLHDLAREFRAKRKFRHITLREYEKQLRAVGFEISKSHKHSGKLVFRDVGAIVYYLKAIPWAVPGFSVEGKLSHLKKLQAKIEKERKLEFEAAKFMILARKPPI